VWVYGFQSAVVYLPAYQIIFTTVPTFYLVVMQDRNPTKLDLGWSCFYYRLGLDDKHWSTLLAIPSAILCEEPLQKTLYLTQRNQDQEGKMALAMQHTCYIYTSHWSITMQDTSGSAREKLKLFPFPMKDKLASRIRWGTEHAVKCILRTNYRHNYWFSTDVRNPFLLPLHISHTFKNGPIWSQALQKKFPELRNHEYLYCVLSIHTSPNELPVGRHRYTSQASRSPEIGHSQKAGGLFGACTCDWVLV
jgi:hypothetical protein